MSSETEALLRELAQDAENVCRRYLPAGRREGNYWLVGDLQNNPGRSLYVRLTGPEAGKGARGRWTDAASGEFGDLLDIIRARTGIATFPELLEEARAHLGRPSPVQSVNATKTPRASLSDKRDAAKRLFAASQPVAGSLAETYLRARGLRRPVPGTVLRFHPTCWHREDGRAKAVPRPALIAAVTDGAGDLQGVHRTWLAADGRGKAPVEVPRRAMGQILGNAVRIDPVSNCLAVGEGIETMLSLREALPEVPVWAALSAGHLGGVLLPEGLRRLYIACDSDPAGARAAERLHARAAEAGIAVRVLAPRLGDFNDDLLADGREALRQRLQAQIGPEDRVRLKRTA
ncbi:toprim domain-containing protein [Marinovum sp.]|uniref:DUF7146 domain-containing protein n=1 Tax=Marinovum sp. TaxID=2024839 RepID=UPI002B27847A|nr:toprim domain-containing protein [Marinovum sp.]